MTEIKVLFDTDLDTSALGGRQIGIVGYGSQGRAQALNLRDSGYTPLIGVRRGKSFDRADRDGFRPLSIPEVSSASDIVMVLTPDETHPHVCNTAVFPETKKDALIGFGAGFSVHFGLVQVPPGRQAILVAPKGPGDVLRQRFIDGGGIPALVASEGDDPEAMLVAMAYAKAIGSGRAGVVKTTFREEAVADLFGEQCVLSGGMIELMKAAFEVLVEKGYTPEVAFIECISEVEYMAALISEVGLANLGEHISSTAYYGGSTRGRRIVDAGVRAKLKAILEEIENGRFFEEFRKSVESGSHSPEPDEVLSIVEKARASFKTVPRRDEQR